MANHTARPSSHSTTGTTAAGWSTKRIATCALLVAIALVASFIELPLFPPAPYLKYDPSGAVGLIAGLVFGPGTAAIVCVLSWLPHVLMNPFGGIMGILCGLALAIPAALVYRRWCTTAGSLVGMAVGAAVTLVVAIVGNIIITPLYAGITTEQVIEMIVPILLPFNLIKIVLNCVVAQLVYKPVSKLIGA